MQGILLRGRAIKTSQAYMKNQGTESNTASMTSNVNPFAAIANNPFLLSTLGSLTGIGNTGMTGMGGVSAYGVQSFQGYPAYQGGMIGMLPGYGVFQGQTMQQGLPIQNQQTSGYGYAGSGVADQANGKFASLENLILLAYQGFQQNYGGGGMIPNAYLGSFFDPINSQNNPSQQTTYMPMGYQQYGVTSTTPQIGQTQGYNPTVNYFQQHQQAIDPNTQGQQVNVYNTTQQASQTITQAANVLQENTNKQTNFQGSQYMIEETQNTKEKVKKI